MINVIEDNYIRIPLTRNLLQFCVQNFVVRNPELDDTYKQKKGIANNYKGFITDHLKNKILIYKGLKQKVLNYLETSNIEYNYIDNQTNNQINLNFNEDRIKLYDYQEQGRSIFLSKERGIISLDCGMGKTILALNILAHLKQKTLIIVHTGKLQTQWFNEIKQNLVGSFSIGLIGNEHYSVGDITIAIVNSLFRLKKEHDLFRTFGFVVSDECHHIPADTFFDVITRFTSKYILGLSATPVRKDKKEFLLQYAIGNLLLKRRRENKLTRILYVEDCMDLPIKVTITDKNTGLPKTKQLKLYRRVQGKRMPNWVNTITAITQIKNRNTKILSRISKCANEGNKILVLSDRRNHCKVLFNYLNKKYNCQLLLGKTSNDYYENQEINSNTQIFIGTKVADEGLDIKTLDTLFLTCPLSIKDDITSLLDQRIGRILRQCTGKTKVQVYVYKDVFIDFFVATWYKIQRYLKSEGFIVRNTEYM